METNPRARISEWAPPPPVAVPPPPPKQHVPTPVNPEKEFEDILGSLVEHYSALPPPSFGEPPVEERTATTARRSRGVPVWLWAVGSFLVVAGTGAGLLLSGVVNLERLGFGASAETPQIQAPAPVTAAVPDVKIRIETPKAQPLPAAEPLAETEAGTEAATANVPLAQEAAAIPAPVKPQKPRASVTKRPRRKRVRRAPRRAPREATRTASRASTGGDDWVDPYAQ